MGISPLATKTIISPNYTKMAEKKNTHIVIHHMAGKATGEQCANIFKNPARKASSQYCIGLKGDIVACVDENNRAWTTSSYAIDSKAVTMEVSNSTLAPNWEVSPEALESTIALCVDICKRNGIPELIYTGDTKGNLHMHCWYAATGCPGPYLKTKFSYIASEVTRRLKGSTYDDKPIVVIPNKVKGYTINGLDYGIIFDSDYYASKYSDVVKVYGKSPNMLWQHFVDYGQHEGRQASAEFNPSVYMHSNKDLEAAFGNNMSLYYWHYLTYGKNEKRKIV